jgi:hypothetical protein
MFIKAGQGTKDDIQGHVNVLFDGTGVTIECMRPDSFEGAFLSIPRVEHENNLVLLIHYNENHILLPGDANGTLLAYLLMHTEDCLVKLRSVSIFLASHHGSTANGEPVWLDAVFNNDTEKNVRLLFVSSDPATRHELPKKDFREMAGRLDLIPHQYGDDTIPFFLTSEAQSVCYRLSIDGNIHLFDGDLQLL